MFFRDFLNYKQLSSANGEVDGSSAAKTLKGVEQTKKLKLKGETNLLKAELIPCRFSD